MIKKFLIFIFMLISKAYPDSLFVNTAYFFTNGEYSNSTKSKSNAFYNATQLNKNFYLLTHLDDLTISSDEWNYKQRNILIGGTISLYPFYIKSNYGFIKGDFSLKPTTEFDYKLYDYTDKTNILNLEAIYSNYPNSFGTSVTGTIANGILNADSLKKQTTVQLEFRFDRFISPKLFVSAKPLITILYDKKKLYSAQIKGSYLLFDGLLFKAGGMFGERAYYFDPDLIIIFNQNETQNKSIFGQIEYDILKNIKIITSYQSTSFTGYKIKYLTIGAKASFNL